MPKGTPNEDVGSLKAKIAKLKRENKELAEAYKNKFKAYIELSKKTAALEKKLYGKG
jgi:hypothetical protein